MVIAAEAGPRAGNGAHAVVDVKRVESAELTAVQVESECRICHLREGDGAPAGGSPPVRLGCACRGELAAAHRQCAEAWFSVRGSRRCEICGEHAANITGWRGGKEFMERWHETAGVDDTGSSPLCGFCRRQSPCNLLVACLIIVLILPWFFRSHMF